MKTLKSFLNEEIANINHWKHVAGTQMGSNEGGIHHNEKGVKHYVKVAKNPEQARQEVASAKIHELLGVKTLRPQLINKGGKTGTATEFRDDLESKPAAHFKKMSEDQARSIMRIHHAGVITKNWDTVGLEHDNIMFHKQTGEPHAVDQGGSFNFRAQGGHKDYGPDVGELHSYRDKTLNSTAAHVFGHIDKKYPHVAKQELTHAAKLNYNDVHHALHSAGVANAETMAKTVIARRDLLLKHYGN